MVSLLKRSGVIGVMKFLLLVGCGLTCGLAEDEFTRQTQLMESPRDQVQDHFGNAVAISGDYAVIGAPGDNEGGFGAGAAYVYVRKPGGWEQQVRIKKPGVWKFQDFFGSSVAIDGNTMVIGSPHAKVFEEELHDISGAAYVYVRTGTVWNLQAILAPSHPWLAPRFGSKVAIEGNTIVVGAPGDHGGTNDLNGKVVDEPGEMNDRILDTGAAYVFTRNGTSWTEAGYLKAADTVNNMHDVAGFQREHSNFGAALAIEGGTIVVGAYGMDRGVKVKEGIQLSAKSYEAGGAYVFTNQRGKWKQAAKLMSPDAHVTDRELFGTSVALSGGTLVIGAPRASTGVFQSGAAYVYRGGGPSWAMMKRLQASNADPLDRFGASVAISGRTIWVGAPDEAGSDYGINGDETLNDHVGSGAVYAFEGAGGAWTQKAYVKPERFRTSGIGTSIAVDGKDTLLGHGVADEVVFFDSEAPKPVIFIHGVAGSVLRSGGNEIWPTVVPTNVAALNLHTGPTDTEAVDVVREYDVGGAGLQVEQFYGPFIRYMEKRIGHREFPLEGQRSRLTSGYMASTTFERKPTFFVFPYDWRKPNASHMATLRQYIQNIRQLHGGEKVSLVVHSMGGLVMRRYLLEYGTEDIDKVVTVGSPILGAPEVSHRMLTGNFFGVAPVDFINNKVMKDAIATMTAVHELLPSSLYHQHWGFPLFQERNVDFNNNGLSDEGYDTSQFRSMVDHEAPFATPSISNIQFHSFMNGRQDDWSADDSSVKFLHIVGKQAVDRTTVGVEVETRSIMTGLDALITPHPTLRFNKVYGEGDGTVPILSSRRLPQYLPPGALMREISEPMPGVESGAQPPGTSAEHTALMSNGQVLTMIAEFLQTGTLEAAPAPAPSAPAKKNAPRNDPPPTLAEALDNSGLSWDPGFEFPWAGQTTVTHDGVDAAGSAPGIGNGQESVLSTSVEGPGTFSVWVKVRSSFGGDIFQVRLNNEDMEGVAVFGDQDWQQIEFDIPEGSHNLALVHINHAEPSEEQGVWLDEATYVRTVPSMLVTEADGTPLNHDYSTIGFGRVAPGGSAQATLQVSNEGNVPLEDVAVTLQGDDAASFSISTLPATLAPGATSTITVTYTPPAGRTVSQSASLRFTSNDPDQGEIVIGLAGSTPLGRRMINVLGAGYVGIRDGNGIINTRVSDIAAGKIPGVQVTYGGEEPWVSIDTDSGKDLILSDDTTDGPVDIEIIETDAAGTPIAFWRYRFNPQGGGWRLAVPASLAPALDVDQNGDHTFAPGERVAPLHTDSGPGIDLTPPDVTLQLSRSGENITLQLSGSDDGGGIVLRYSIDGGALQTFSGSLSFPAGTAASVRVFAEDPAGNLSGVIETAIQPPLAISKDQPGSLKLRWPVADGYILQESTDLNGTWTRSDLKPARDGATSSAAIQLGGEGPRKFYRLIASPVRR
ncbi:alpha/beta fold hydrolase [Luteolibacter sp. SL250]|uniref:alpha/beta fold hydrolase n=1 Tax=Luteolibacter sp. SL250 TaxID=2995170 RepID=UPI00226EF542|nr:alpha/beta fold hydrolase [Luteolibacter sp. SL250]WAC19098.1 alpha/beta fold hydrolase [Luteolibacter sp. SL250]